MDNLATKAMKDVDSVYRISKFGINKTQNSRVL